MSRCPECEALEPSGCQCVVDDGDCFTWGGDGSEATPFIIEPALDADLDNLITCSSEGMLAQLPALIANPPAVRAYRTSNLSVANNTLTAVNLNQEVYDTDTMHDMSSNTNRVTFTTAGTYIVTFNCAWNKNATGIRLAQIRLNGSDILCVESKTTGEPDLIVSHALTIEESFAAADYVEGMVHQTSGGALSLLAGTGSTFLSATRVGPA